MIDERAGWELVDDVVIYVAVDEYTLKCPICYCSFKRPQILPCGHNFCSNCLKTHWLHSPQKGSIKCPVCKQPAEIPKGDVAEFMLNIPLLQQVEEARRIQKWEKQKAKPEKESQPTVVDVESENGGSGWDHCREITREESSEKPSMDVLEGESSEVCRLSEDSSDAPSLDVSSLEIREIAKMKTKDTSLAGPVVHLTKVTCDSLTCRLCQERFKKRVRKLRCSHSFCEGCLKAVVVAAKSYMYLICPTCDGETIVPEEGITGLIHDRNMDCQVDDANWYNERTGDEGNLDAIIDGVIDEERDDWELPQLDQQSNELCISCLNVARKPMYLPCGHGCCENCIERIKTIEESQGDWQIICSSCQNEYSSDDLLEKEGNKPKPGPKQNRTVSRNLELFQLLGGQLPDELIALSSVTNTSNGTTTSAPSSPPRTVNAPGTLMGTNVSGSPKPALQGMGGTNIKMDNPVPNSLMSPRPSSVPTPNMAMNLAGGVMTTDSSNLTNASATMVSYSNTGNMHNPGNLMAGNNKPMMQNGPFSIASSMNTSLNNSIGRSTVTTTAMGNNNANLLVGGAGGIQTGMGNMQPQLNQQVMAKGHQQPGQAGQNPQQAGMTLIGSQAASGSATLQKASAADPHKRKLIQQQLVLLLHAHKCQRRENQANGEIRQCALPHCRTMKNVLNHMTNCRAGKSCQVTHCPSSRQIIGHWKNCTRSDCPVCLPLKNANDRQAQQALLASMPIGPINTLPTPTSRQIDQNAMQRAYHSNNQIVSQGMPQSFGTTSDASSSQPNLNNLPNASLPSGLPSMARFIGPAQAWHQFVTQNLRNHLVDRLVQAIVPVPDSTAIRDRHTGSIVAYAHKVEKDVYEQASSKEEYYHLIAEKIWKIQQELEENRQNRISKMKEVGTLQEAGNIETVSSESDPQVPQPADGRTQVPSSKESFGSTNYSGAALTTQSPSMMSAVAQWPTPPSIGTFSSSTTDDLLTDKLEDNTMPTTTTPVAVQHQFQHLSQPLFSNPILEGLFQVNPPKAAPVVQNTPVGDIVSPRK